MSLGKQRRRARDEETHIRADVTIEAGMFEQAGVEGRHPHHRRCSRQRRNHRCGIELRHEDHRRPRQQRDVDRYEQPMRMKDRQRVNESVGGPEAPTVDQSQRVRRQILVRQHRAF
jgi:hypothetical protein